MQRFSLQPFFAKSLCAMARASDYRERVLRVPTAWADPRVAGALVALLLAAPVLALGVVIVFAGVSQGLILVTVGIIAVVVGPVTGWRFGCQAADPSARDWGASALGTMLVAGLVLAAVWIVVSLIVNPVVSDLPGVLGYVAYAALFSGLTVVVLTFTVGIALGLAWRAVMRRLFR
jgi:hypothetical protein